MQIHLLPSITPVFRAELETETGNLKLFIRHLSYITASLRVQDTLCQWAKKRANVTLFLRTMYSAKAADSQNRKRKKSPASVGPIRGFIT